VGLPAVDGGFELICGEAAVGQRRHLDAGAVEKLDAFSRRYYELLQSSQAVAAARRELLNASEEGKRRDWHLARVWLGPAGGGPQVGGNLRRARLYRPRAQGG
jgi:hypothetical protein